MSGDRLAQAEEWVRLADSGDPAAYDGPPLEAVRALVGIAKVARRLTDAADARTRVPFAPPEGRGAYQEWCAIKNEHIDAIEAARSALARLDSGAAA